MATIIINRITHRNACLAGGSDADMVEYDQAESRIFEQIAAAAATHGHTLQINWHGDGANSYIVESDDYDDEREAHEFMQSPSADFWQLY